MRFSVEATSLDFYAVSLALAAVCLIEYRTNFFSGLVDKYTVHTGGNGVDNVKLVASGKKASHEPTMCNLVHTTGKAIGLSLPAEEGESDTTHATSGESSERKLIKKGHGIMNDASKVDVITRMLPHPTDECFSPSRLRDMEYAVRGQIPIMAQKISMALRNGDTSYPFKELIYCNIGNPIQVGYKPLSYMREVMGAYWSKNTSVLPDDLKAKMNYILESTKPGAYTLSRGEEVFIKMVEKWMNERDGYDCKGHETQIFLSNGASDTISLMLEYLVDTSLGGVQATEVVTLNGEEWIEDHTMEVVGDVMKLEAGVISDASNTHLKHGVFLPVPQYPLYSATLERLGGVILPYYLKEEQKWDLPTVEEFDELYIESLTNGVLPKAIVIINPGNPTGSVISEENLVTLLEFAQKRKLVVLSDEVYQTNIWGDRPFISARKVMYKNNLDVKLCSFQSTSKGFWGECGVRGGMMAMDNFPKHVIALIDKCTCVRLCSNVTGQLAMAFACQPPLEGEASYPLYRNELDAAQKAMKKKALTVYEAFNSWTNMSCQEPMGALYVFPKIGIPEKGVKDAESKGLKPDAMYCIELLETCGIVCVPGSGFRQFPGTFHLRMTILPQLESLIPALEKFRIFHESFMARYA